MKKKLLALVLCLALIVVAVIGTTLAYFTDKTDSVTNTFTVGDVSIKLDEPNWDSDNATLMPGKYVPKDPTIEVSAESQDAWVFIKVDINKYFSFLNLVGVDAYKSEIAGLSGTYSGLPAFWTALDTDAKKQAVFERWFEGIDFAKWEFKGFKQLADEKHAQAIFGYKTALSAGDKAVFMKKFGMPGTVTKSMMTGEDAYMVGTTPHSASNFNTNEANFNMEFMAYAIQKDGIDTLGDAYDALGGADLFDN